MSIDLNDVAGRMFTTDDDFAVSVDYAKTISVGYGDYRTQVELDDYGVVQHFLVMCSDDVLLSLDGYDYSIFNKMEQLVAGERLRLTVNKIRKEKEGVQ